MGFVSASRGRNTPASAHLMSEPAIVAALAKAALGLDWSDLVADYDRIRDLIEKVVDGCADYNARVRSGGFHLRNAARERDFSGVPGGRARFFVHPLPEIVLAEDELLLTTIRSHDQFNTTVYTQNDRYRGISGDRRVVFMNERDIDKCGLVAGERVDVESSAGRVEHFAVVPFSIPEGNVAAYFPEANPLVPLGSYADKSRTPTSKSVPVRIRKKE